ncbi:MAG: zinc-dependent metalloprotease [Myxococcota bacterium]|nr:zinc-dependent metalloprotease [Myxococcota bacterium]
MPRHVHRLRSLLLLTSTLFATSAVVVGCAEPRAAINRVQPGAIQRSVFEGEWYFQQTVIDSPYSAGYTFVGEQGELERVRWEIQEDFLVARRAYEHIAGSEAGGIAGAGTELGAPIAMYAIESHFDIRREYNPLTGEQLNIIGENSADRPWYERDYLRVDWSENLITNSDFLVLARVFDAIETEPVAYDIREPNHPHAPRFEAQDESGVWDGVSVDVPVDGEVEYIDIVNKMFVRPSTVDIEGLGPVPSCFLLYQGHYDCAPGEVTVRNSFLRVDHEDTDYEPQVYTGDRMERFGYFVTERAGYDDHYGPIEPARYRFANRHNLWAESHRKDAEGSLVSCTDDAACGGNGSVCDLDLARAMRTVDAERRFVGACTIPYRERAVRPIAYHLSANFPADLEPDAQHLSDQWNLAFRDTVASLREIECRENGGDEGSCASERMREDGQQVFVLCHNPVQETDHAACGPRETSARPGDLRYSMIGWVSDAHRSSPLGYGPSSADPLTGEIIMGNAFVYGAAMETLTTFANDIIRLMNGDLDEGDISSGAQVEAWIERMSTAAGSEETGRSAHDHAIEVDGLDAARINEAMDFSWARAGRRGTGARAPESAAELIEAMGAAENRLWSAGAFGAGDDRAEARLGNLVGTDIERMMTTSEMRLMAGVDPSLPVGDGILEEASPLRGNSLPNLRALSRERERLQHDHCVLGAEFADDSLLSLARAITRAASGDGTMEWYGVVYNLRNADGRLDYELVRSMLRHPIFDAVTAHEVGHTIGLRHNFSGSYDAVNYLPRYWELRNDGEMLPRAWDPMSAAEIDGGILEYSYSTVMDYGVNFVVTDAHGIGHYDYAAVKMGYGDLVEVFDNAASPGDVAWLAFIQSAGWPVPLRLDSFLAGGEPSAHMYTEWPDILGGVERLEQRADVRYTSLVSEPGLVRVGIDDPFAAPDGRPIVPYLFCSDEQADLNPDCMRYDQGADAYESMQSVMDNYWNYYIFNNFRRARLGFSPESVASRVHDRYFEKIQRANQIYSLYRGVFEGIFGDSAGYDRFWTRPDGMGAWTVAVGAGFQMLTRVITAPEPGNYASAVRGDGTAALLPADFGEPVAVAVNAFDGRSIETTWDFDAGYYWFDQLDRVGYFYDKTIALQVLVDPTTYFLGRDTDSDIRRYQINFGSSFGPALTAFMQGVLSDDWALVGPRAPASPTAGLIYPDPLNLELADMAGTPIDPNASFSIQLYAAVYGMAYIPQTYDQNFLNRSRIFARGGAEELELAPGTPLVEFTNPTSGVTYVAVSYPAVDGHETGVGAAMLNHANELALRGATTELRSFVDNIDVVRSLTWRLGFGAQP